MLGLFVVLGISTEFERFEWRIVTNFICDHMVEGSCLRILVHGTWNGVGSCAAEITTGALAMGIETALGRTVQSGYEAHLVCKWCQGPEGGRQLEREHAGFGFHSQLFFPLLRFHNTTGS